MKSFALIVAALLLLALPAGESKACDQFAFSRFGGYGGSFVGFGGYGGDVVVLRGSRFGGFHSVNSFRFGGFGRARETVRFGPFGRVRSVTREFR